MSARPFLSSSWYRVAGLRPRLREHATVHRHRYRGSVWYVVHDHATGRVHRVSPASGMVVDAMDGRRTVDELWHDGGVSPRRRRAEPGRFHPIAGAAARRRPAADRGDAGFGRIAEALGALAGGHGGCRTFSIRWRCGCGFGIRTSSLTARFRMSNGCLAGPARSFGCLSLCRRFSWRRSTGRNLRRTSPTASSPPTIFF